MPDRFIFRMTYYLDVPLFLRDGALHAKNHAQPQLCHQASYGEIVSRRGDTVFSTPCGRVVNDFVPFYFSPITAMAYTIHKGNVSLRAPSGCVLGAATMDDRVFFVSNVNRFRSENIPFYFTNLACNTMSIQPEYCKDLDQIENHIDWSLFDEGPRVASIPEIGYTGVTAYFANRDTERYRNRSAQRMAEFLVQSSYPLHLVDCIITKNEAIRAQVAAMVGNSKWNIPVIANSGCYF